MQVFTIYEKKSEKLQTSNEGNKMSLYQEILLKFRLEKTPLETF